MGNSRSARRKLARLDGTTVNIKACCNLEITIAPTRLTVRHDDNCPALDPSTPEGITARLQANQAVAQVMTARGITAAVAYV